MNRKEFDSLKIKEFGGEYLPRDVRLEYFERLIKPYKKQDNQFFILQYLNGDGNELNQKFWSIHSSSRFAFELYSWMAADNRVSGFEFEKKLVGLHGSPKVPNMDVYIKIKNRIIFIESKFCEASPQNINNLSESYYLEKGEAKNSRGGKVESELIDRYYGDKQASEKFSNFIRSVKSKLDCNSYKRCWMDFKQEITHLFGIYFTIKKNQREYVNKDILFLNVYYDFQDKTNDVIEWFFQEANKLMNTLLKNKCLSFTYNHISAQNLVKSEQLIKFNSNTKAFGLESKTIGELLKKYFELSIE